jgi:hypothetical protein
MKALKDIEVRYNRLILIDRSFPDYHEMDVTPVYHFLKEFFRGDWKAELGERSR